MTFVIKQKDLKEPFDSKPLTKQEWKELQLDWKLVCSSEKRKNFTTEDAKKDYSWSHYVVGRLIETVKQGINYEN